MYEDSFTPDLPKTQNKKNSKFFFKSSNAFFKRTLTRKLFLFLIIATLVPPSSWAQRYMEDLGRGVVAVRTSASEVFVSWRMLGTDPSDVTFNLYRGTTLVNSTPISGSTNFVDNTSIDESYTVRPVVNGTEGTASAPATVWAQQYKEIPLQVPAGGTTPDGVDYTYSPNDASVGDVDGDGEYEIILKWDPSNSKDNSQSGYTGNVYLDAYKMNGTHLWRIDLGRNIRAGAHYTQFIVYDLDSDGKAEIACKTADATIDGLGQVIGDPNADYRTSNGYILEGPEYLTIFNGKSGAAMATTDYLPARGNVCDWGDCYGNRVDRFLAGVGYFDGQRPSLLMTRGYYTRSVLVAWDWRNGSLTQRWIFDSKTAGNEAYAGQGYHSLSINDVDEDGKDEVVFGSMTVDDNGMGLYSTGLGHGDALHAADLDPNRPGQETWTCHESPSAYEGNGLWFRDASSGEKLWGVPATGDVGRALTANIDPNHKGAELWGSTGGLYNISGQEISSSKPHANFAIWWDGDLQRELLDGDKMDKWNYSSQSLDRIFTIYLTGAAKNNGTKANPGLSADILGDWREEMIFRHNDNSKLMIFTTTTPTDHRFYSLMHDPQYRTSIAWQNVGYNQPPHTSFYLGNDMMGQPAANILIAENDGTTHPNVSLIASAGDSEVSLSWTVSEMDVKEQEVYRDLDSDPAGSEKIASLGGAERGIKDSTAENGTTYYYWIKATDEEGTVANSNAASATPQGKVEVLLTATAGNEEVILDWTVSNIDLKVQEVYRDLDSNPSGRVRLASLGTTERNYVDNSVANGTTYYYWIKATDVNGEVTNSNAANATPQDAVEVNLAATAGDGEVALDWTVSGINLQSQEIYRDLDSNPSGSVQIASLGTLERSYVDNAVENGTTYYYWVKVTDMVTGTVTTSNVANATPSINFAGTYVITSRHSGKVLDVHNSSMDNGANILQNASVGSDNQKWIVQRLDDGYYTIKNVYSGKVLDVEGASTTSGANILQWDSTSSLNQQWQIIDHRNGYYSFISRNSGHAMEVEQKRSKKDGANIRQGTYSGTEYRQQFSLIATSSNKTMNSESEKDILSVDTADKAVIYPNPSTGSFTIVQEGAFTYSIYDYLGRVMEVGKGNETIQTGEFLVPGLYIIQIKTGTSMQQIKWIKK